MMVVDVVAVIVDVVVVDVVDVDVVGPVLKLLPSASVTGGQVQIRWAGFAWH